MFGGKLLHLANQLLLENPGKRKSLDEWGRALEKSGAALAARAGAAEAESERNHAKLNHIIGIERWCQRRLRVFLGQPAVRDEYDGYRPGGHLDWSAQIAAFTAARAETVALIEQLADVPPESLPATVDHNQYGPLSLFAWLRYMDMHANWEARRLR